MFEPHTICFLSSDIPKSDVLNLIQATFLLSVVEKIICLSLTQPIFCCRVLKNRMLDSYKSYFFVVGLPKIKCSSPIQATFCRWAFKKSYFRALYKLLFCRRAFKNHMFEPYTSCLFIVGRPKIMCSSLIQFMFLSSGVLKSYV